MAIQRQFDPNSENVSANTVSLGARIAASRSFKTLFQDGMGLVERTAAYLDGDGRNECKALPRPIALAYATESMRLTTRLMRIASWLLYQRAINEGDVSKVDALAEKAKWRADAQGLAASAEIFVQLPEVLQDLCQQSLRIQQRVAHLEGLIYAPFKQKPETNSPLQALHRQLHQAFDSA